MPLPLSRILFLLGWLLRSTGPLSYDVGADIRVPMEGIFAGIVRGARGYQSLQNMPGNWERKTCKTCSRWAAAVCVLLLLLVLVYGRPSLRWTQTFGSADAGEGWDYGTSSKFNASRDQLLGGLLSPQFDETSCLSRFQAALYRKATPHIPSPHLIEKLRSYEALHRRCGPNTQLYKKSIQLLKSKHAAEPMECNYIIWIPHYGLGNRIVSLVSTFFYALLNHKVLLVHVPDEISHLFCEPFPGTSWLLPSDFPIHNLDNLDKDSPQSYGNILRDKLIRDSKLPAYVYLHLPWYYNAWDKQFFCQDAQRTLRGVPWLLLKSDHYFVPALFLVQEYEEELGRLFPERTTVFHHLVRYLVHPSNDVWGHVMRYYRAYLAKADQRIGIQVRNLKNEPVKFDYLLGQIIGCSQKEGILPKIVDKPTNTELVPTMDAKEKAVFMTSLDLGYFERVRDMYYEHPTATGEVVGVYEASHEMEQRTEERAQNVKALAEMTLLSFSDVLVTSACSTFGYVAQGLGGLVPLVMLKPWKASKDCSWTKSPEPCFLIPPRNVCNERSGFNKVMASKVRVCEDEIGGVKLF